MDKKYLIARKLRNNMTEQEKKLWFYLRKRFINNYRFRRQHPIGEYIIDFICKEKKLIIEIDGGQHNTLEAKEYDDTRTKFLESKGYKVVRFWNCDIDNNIESVLDSIYKLLC